MNLISLENISKNFNEPSPYGDGKTLWKDDFQDGKIASAHNYKYDAQFAVPYFGMGLAYYYNKDIYEKLGLKVPKTWNEFMSNCAACEKAGYKPISLMLMKEAALSWMEQYVGTGLFAKKYLLDTRINVNKDGYISPEEWAKAIDDGYLDITKGEDRELLEQYIDILHQYAKYCPGASGLDEAGAKSEFLAGKSAHIMSGSWDLQAFLNYKGQNIGAFPFPKFTTENGKYAGDNYGVDMVQVLSVSKTKDDDKRKAAIDFVQFLTSKDINQIFMKDTYSIPTIKGISVSKDFAAFTKYSAPMLQLYSFSSDTNEWSLNEVSNQALMGKKIDLDKISGELVKSLNERSATIKKNSDIGPQNNYGFDNMVTMGKMPE